MIKPQTIEHLRRCCAALLAMLPLWASSAVASGETVSEAAVRATLVFNLIKFTEWPAGANSGTHLQLCVATLDPEIQAKMEALNALLVRNKPLLITRYQQQSDCDVIYVNSRRMVSLLEKHPTRPVLTIGGYAGFLAEGGMVEIDLSGGSPRFDINQAEAKRVGLRFYPQLLKLARRLIE